MNSNKAWYMQQPYNAFWELGYQDKNLSCMGGPSFEVIQVSECLPSDAVVLDLGCGEGRNAFFLASKGFSVTAIDRSGRGIEKLNSLCDKHSIPINAYSLDIREFQWTDTYDLIMGHGILYYLKNKQWLTLLTHAKQHTKPGGFHIYTIFIYDDQYPCTSETKAAHYLGSLSPYEIQQFYSEWGEVRFDKYVKWDAHPGIPLHYHPIEKLVTRKPNGKPIEFISELITDTPQISEQLFHKIHIGMSKSDLITLLGKTNNTDIFKIKGYQYGPSGLANNQSAIIKNYVSELWYYGNYVIYLINDRVDGRALYFTQPQRILTNKSLGTG